MIDMASESKIMPGDRDYQARAASADLFEIPHPESIVISYQGIVDAGKREWDAPTGLKSALQKRFPEGKWLQTYILTIETPETRFDEKGKPVQDEDNILEISLSFRKKGSDPESPIALVAVRSVANIYQIPRYYPHPDTDRIGREYGLIPKDETSVLFEGVLNHEIGTQTMRFELRQDTLASLPEDLQKTILDRQSRHAQAFLPVLDVIVEHATAPSKNLLPRIPAQNSDI